MANVIFAAAGSSDGGRSQQARSITRDIKKRRKDFRRSHANDSSAPSRSSTGTAKSFSALKRSIAHCNADLRDDGWLGVTITFLASAQSLNSLINSSPVTADLPRPLRGCFGATMSGRRLILARDAGFCALLVSSI